MVVIAWAGVVQAFLICFYLTNDKYYLRRDGLVAKIQAKLNIKLTTYIPNIERKITNLFVGFNSFYKKSCLFII